MQTIELRELCDNASELVHRVESGEEFTIIVAGRPSARLMPVVPSRRWRTCDEIADLWAGPADTER